MTIKWDLRFLELADHVANWSKDPSTQVGAVMTDDSNRILGIGYNGFPRGVIDYHALLNDREEKYKRVVHAEVNCILNSTCQHSMHNATLYCTHFPCSHCAAVIIQSGIKHVVSYSLEEAFYTRFKDSIMVSESMFNQADVKYWLYSRQGDFIK